MTQPAQRELRARYDCECGNMWTAVADGKSRLCHQCGAVVNSTPQEERSHPAAIRQHPLISYAKRPVRYE